MKKTLKINLKFKTQTHRATNPEIWLICRRSQVRQQAEATALVRQESMRENKKSTRGRAHVQGGVDSTSPLTSLGCTLMHVDYGKDTVVELLHWQDTKQTSVVFSSMLLLLFSLTQFSVVSVAAYLALAALATTISFRVYKSVLQAVQKTDDGHPFRAYLEKEITLSPEQIRTYVAKVQLYVNFTLKELRRLFLVQDLVDSLKFAVLMWLLTYVGALFNGLTLLIQAVVGVFTVPLVYEKYKKQIDQYLAIVQMQVNSVMMTLREKVPGAKSKNE